MTINRSKKPDISLINPDKIGIDSLIPEHLTFSNGVKCYQIKGSKQDVVKIDFIFEAGSFFQQKTFSAFSTVQMLTEGTKKYNSENIALIFDFYGSYIEKDIDRDYATITVYSLNKHLDKIISVVEEIIKYPVFPENELNIFKEKQKSQLLINKEKVNYIARTKFTELLYGENHPYGKNVDIDDIDNINAEDLLVFYKNNYNSENCKIIISGSVNDEVINLIELFFGNDIWGDVNKKSEMKYFNPEKVNSRFHHINKQKTVQSAIRIGRQMFSKHHADYHTMKIINTILGGYFGSRLMKNIREDKGYTYGIGSALISLKYSGYFFISTEVGKEYTNKTIIEINNEIEKLASQKIYEDELNLVKNYKFGEFLRSIDGSFAISEIIKPIVLFDLDKNFYKIYLQTIKNITPDDILTYCEKYFNYNKMIQLTVGEK